MSNMKKLTEGGGGGGGEEGGESILNCNTTKLLKKLDYQQPLQAFLRRVCWGRIDFLKGSIVIYSWYRYL